MKRYKNVLLMLGLLLSMQSKAGDIYTLTDSTGSEMSNDKTCTSCCCDGAQSPAGIMTDHVHPKGKWMVSYSYMNMMMQGNRIGNQNVSNDEIYQTYVMAPDHMTMQMHMVMAMYGITDRLTAMVMGGYAINKMNMKMDQQGMDMMMNMPGMQTNSMAMMDHMTSTAQGITDTRLYALYGIINNSKQRLTGGLGISLPTGTINAQGMTLNSLNDRLAYQMQIGTGSYSLLPSLTYVRMHNKISWGGAAGADVKMNTNSLGYRVGNIYNATAWGGYKFLPFVSGSLRAEYVATGKTSGYDTETAMLMNNDPSANTTNYGGQRVNAYAGLNFATEKLRGLGLLLEYGMPVYEHLNGLQMHNTGNIYATLQYMF